MILKRIVKTRLPFHDKVVNVRNPMKNVSNMSIVVAHVIQETFHRGGGITIEANWLHCDGG